MSSNETLQLNMYEITGPLLRVLNGCGMSANFNIATLEMLSMMMEKVKFKFLWKYWKRQLFMFTKISHVKQSFLYRVFNNFLVLNLNYDMELHMKTCNSFTFPVLSNAQSCIYWIFTHYFAWVVSNLIINSLVLMY